MKTNYNMILVAVLLITAPLLMFAQNVGINDDGSSPNSKAMLDVKSTTKGFLPPRMTYTERNAITGVPAGLIIWCSNCGPSGELQIYNGTAWKSLTAGTASGLPGAPIIGTAIAGNGQATVFFTAPVSDGGSTITSYTATSLPGSITGTVNQAGSGTITVTALTNGTAYTFTITATNATGTGPASAASNSVTPGVMPPFVCGDPLVDARDGKSYTTVLIGTQCWFAQSLNIGTRINASVSQTNNSIIEKYCYNNIEANCDIYGGLYQWDELMDYSTSSNSSPSGRQGICPAGWHIPSHEELSTLRTFCGGEYVAGGKLKEVGTSHWASPNYGATNSYGFTCLPCGFSYSDGSFNSLHLYTHISSATETSSSQTWRYGMHYDNTTLPSSPGDKSQGSFVRCLKD